MFPLLTVKNNFLATIERLPEFFEALGFKTLPTKKELRERYFELARVHHPDVGGNAREFRRLRAAYELALMHLNSL